MIFFKIFKILYVGKLKKLIFLLVMMVPAMIAFVVAMGMFRYNDQILDQSNEIQSLQGVYLMQWGESSYNREHVLNTIEEIKEFSGVAQVVTTRTISGYYKDQSYTVILCDDPLQRYFFPASIQEKMKNNDHSICISGSQLYSNILGKTIEIECKDNEYSVEVAGLLKRGMSVPRFSRSSTNLSMQGMLYPAYGHMGRYILVSEKSELYLENKEDFYVYRNILVLFCEDATSEDQEVLLQFLQTKGGIVFLNDIIQTTKEECEKTSFVARYLLLFSSMALILVLGISLSLVREMHYELAIYSICGCSRVMRMILASFGIFGVSLISFIVQVIFNQHYYGSIFYEYFGEILLDSTNLMLAAGYAASMIAICVISAWILNRKTQLVYDLQEIRK